MADYTALSQTNTPATPVTNTLHNQIAANDAYFKDSPEMNNVTVTGTVTAPTINTGSGDIANPLDQAVKTTDSVTHAAGTFTGAVQIDGSLMPTSLGTSSSWNLTSSSFVIPRGIYMIKHVIGTTQYSIIEMLSVSVWRAVSFGQTNGDAGFFIFSDGTNVRARMQSGSGQMYYLKF